MTTPPRSSWLFAVVLAAAAVAWALPFRQPNCNTASHYALVQSLAHGRRTIDAYHGQSCDISWWHGHYFANKAPGLALATVPWYLALKAAGLVKPDPAAGGRYPAAMRALPQRDLWLMGLWGAVLPGLILLMLVRREGDRLVRGSGTAAAATLAFSTLVLVFAGLFFSHVLSALLDFAAFAVVSRGRSPGRAAAGGGLAGLAVTVEYPNAILVVVLFGLMATTRGGRLRTSASYLGGCLAGLLPLLLFDQWAFGSPFHLSYVGAVLHTGVTGHDVLGANTAGFFGVGVPSLHRLFHLLVGHRGLLTSAPVLALAPIGIAKLWRNGNRRQAAVIAAIAVTFIAYDAGYYSPIGGASPGPRFLVVILPFVAIPVAVAMLVVPRFVAVALVGVGTLVLLAADTTQPLIGHGYTPLSWWRWIRAGTFTSTILDPAGHGWAPAALIATAVTAGLAAGAASLTRVRG